MAADFSKDEFVQLLKRFGTYLTLKISNLLPISLNHQNARSIGALAGLLVAIIFTWKILRTPTEPRRRRHKRRGPPPGNVVNPQPNEVTLTSGVCSSSADSKAQDVIDEFFQPVKLTLGQVVRQKFSDGRKVTCRLLGVILEENSPEELKEHATVKSSVLEVLLEITKFCDLYLMERILDDESGERVLLALETAGVFTSGGLVKDKVSCVVQKTGDHLLFGNWNQIGTLIQVRRSSLNWLASSNTNSIFRPTGPHV